MFDQNVFKESVDTYNDSVNDEDYDFKTAPTAQKPWCSVEFSVGTARFAFSWVKGPQVLARLSALKGAWEGMTRKPDVFGEKTPHYETPQSIFTDDEVLLPFGAALDDLPGVGANPPRPEAPAKLDEAFTCSFCAAEVPEGTPLDGDMVACPGCSGYNRVSLFS